MQWLTLQLQNVMKLEVEGFIQDYTQSELVESDSWFGPSSSEECFRETGISVYCLTHHSAPMRMRTH